MTLLLGRRGADVQITEEVVKAAVGNDNGKEVMALLLDWRGADVQITEEVVALIAERFDHEVMTLLLDQQGADVQITEEGLEARGGRNNNGEVMMMLLE